MLIHKKPLVLWNLVELHLAKGGDGVGHGAWCVRGVGSGRWGGVVSKEWGMVCESGWGWAGKAT